MPQRTKSVHEIILYLMIVLIFAAVIWQIGTTMGFARTTILQIWKTIGQSATWRGVNFSAGQNFANYLAFLIEVIPPDQRVIIPPEGVGPPALGRTPYMQFFLAPRKVINCTAADPACAENFLAGGAAVIAVQNDDFPGAGFSENLEQLAIKYVPFDQNLGVYLPATLPDAPVVQESYSSLLEIGADLIWPFIWLITLAGAGSLLVIRLGMSGSFLSQRLVQLALGFGIGVGSLTLLLYLWMLLGLALSRGLILIITLLIVAGFLLVFLLLGSRDEKFSFGRGRWLRSRTVATRWLEGMYLMGLGLIAGISLILAVGQGYSVGDEVVLWGVKGYGIALNGLQAGVAEWGTRTTNYPLHIPLLIAAFKSLFGEALPESKIIFPLYQFVLSVLLFKFLQHTFIRQFPYRPRLSLHLAGGLCLLYTTVPLIFYHGTLAYANLPLSYALVSASLLFIASFSPGDADNDQDLALQRSPGSTQPSPPSAKILLLSGLFFVLAAWTRPEGLAISVLALIILSIWIFFPGWPGSPRPINSLKKRLSDLLALAGPLGIYALLWQFTAPMVYPGAGWSQVVFQGGLEKLISGNMNLEGVQFVLSKFLISFIQLNSWGLLGIGLVLFLTGLLIARRCSNSGLILILIGLVCFVTILGMYFLIANDPGSNVSWWVDTGLSRMLIPGMTLVWLGVVIGLSGIWNDASIHRNS